MLLPAQGGWQGRAGELVPWPSYSGTRSEEGGFLKDSLLEGKGFQKSLCSRMIVGEAGTQRGPGAGPEQQSHRCLSSGSLESCPSHGGSGAFD